MAVFIFSCVFAILTMTNVFIGKMFFPNDSLPVSALLITEFLLFITSGFITFAIVVSVG